LRAARRLSKQVNSHMKRFLLTRQKLKDEYHANKSKPTGEKKKTQNAVGKDGILESDSEDERLVRENKKKRKAAAEAGEAKEEEPVKEAKRPVAKKQITKA
jgi:hypothetical protein